MLAGVATEGLAGGARPHAEWRIPGAWAHRAPLGPICVSAKFHGRASR